MIPLLLSALIAQPSAAHLTRAELTVVKSNLNASGITPGTWPVPGVAAPTVAWWGDDPTGSLGKSSHTFTASGSPVTSIDTPFCPGGSWADVGVCLQAVRFDHSAYYSGPSNSVGDLVDGQDFSVCALARLDIGGGNAYMMVGKYAGARGYYLSATSSSDTAQFQVYSDSTVYRTGPASTLYPGSWGLVCGTVARSGNQCAYGSGNASTCTAAGAGTAQAAAPMLIGNWQGDATHQWRGDIAFVGVWPTVALSAAQVKALYQYFTGILDSTQKAYSFSSTGPTACWVDGQISAFSDDMPRVGCEIAPGLTGAGTPTASGYYAGASLTNSIKYSRDLSTGWTCVGSGCVACSQAKTPFRDGRTTCKVVDDDAGSAERIYQFIDMSSLATGDKIAVCVDVAADSSQGFRLLVGENSGTDCTATYPALATGTATTAWQRIEAIHTVADGDCTSFGLYIEPTPTGATTETGSIYAIPQVFLSTSACPRSDYIETSAAAVTAGADVLAYTVTGSPILDAAGALKAGTRVRLSYAPVSSITSTVALYRIADSATATDHWTAYIAPTTGVLSMSVRSAESGTVSVWTSGNLTWTPGTTYSIDMRLNAAGALMTVLRDGVALAATGGTATIGTPPDSLDYLYAGAAGTVLQANGIVTNIKVSR